MSYISVYIDIDDILSSCGSRDIKKIIEALIEDGHLNENAICSENGKYSTPGENMHDENCSILASKYYQLTKEETDYIEELARKYK